MGKKKKSKSKHLCLIRRLCPICLDETEVGIAMVQGKRKKNSEPMIVEPAPEPCAVCLERFEQYVALIVVDGKDIKGKDLKSLPLINPYRTDELAWVTKESINEELVAGKDYPILFISKDEFQRLKLRIDAEKRAEERGDDYDA